MNTQNPFLVSIITVNLNNDSGLEKTIKSIEKQTYKHVELIIVDGGSTDQSLALIQTHSHVIHNAIIGKDSGIYDAMNIGLSHMSVHSDFVIFLNSGDVFFCPEVIAMAMHQASPLESVYGNVVKGSLVSYKSKSVNLRGLASHMICHQAIFFSSVLHRNVLYNTEFTIAADYELLVKAVKNGWKFHYIDLPIAVLQIGGVSSIQRKLLFEQKKVIRSNHKELMFWYYLHKIKTILK